MQHPTASTLRKLSGPVPGLLDPTQPARLLRGPKGTLTFASFDPHAASAKLDLQDVQKISLNSDPYRPKRVVIDFMPNGQNRWRFVPKARLEEGVTDEGTWPRTVDICGLLYDCSQDQWDIYKLDPDYDCCVRLDPDVPVISRRKHAPETHLPPTPEKPPGKRGPSPPLERPTKRTYVVDANSSDEESEAQMSVDEPPRRSRSASIGAKAARGQRLRQALEEQRRARKELNGRRAEKLSTAQDDAPSTHHPPNASNDKSSSTPVDPNAKRKVSSLFNPLRNPRNEPEYVESSDEDEPGPRYTSGVHSKRARTLSPASAKRALDLKRQEREKSKKERRDSEREARRQAKEMAFLEELMADASQQFAAGSSHHHENGNGASQQPEQPLEDDDDDDVEAVRLSMIEESRRKLAQLESDRPLWEQAAHLRKVREQTEEAEARAKAEARRAEQERMEEERRARARREAEARAREEAMKREEAARKEAERRKRNQRYSAGPWTTQRALERCRTLSEYFDTTKYSSENPLCFDDIPWPVLSPPQSFSAEDIDWSTVEKFFRAIRVHMKPLDYKSFVEKCHKRFHPDRWRSRGLLKSIADETERNCLEVAANTVAQALTPIWQDVTGR
ncbi:hypothetical protein ONZ45_g3158 [Pleurotus djamor]|nr:hypothetical protein ONZ45_g3158 [Pleurotus djamor]